MGHHGCSGSNTAAYLDALSPLYVFQTGRYPTPTQTVWCLANLGSRYASADDACDDGLDAYVVTLSAAGVTTNFDYAKPPRLLLRRGWHLPLLPGWSSKRIIYGLDSHGCRLALV